MSEALEYLLKVRPDAMKSYFGFLKESGKHLDPKTRAIISVITKVDNQTRAGFKQYLNRALQAGVTPNEIIDALLTAFPTLGLTKIIWAIEQLLEMDIPQFRPESMEQDAQWHDVVAVAGLKEKVTYTSCDGRSLFIYKNADDIHVYDSLCPHQATNIPQLSLEGEELVCPKHQWKFDISNGMCIEKGDRPLTEFEHKIHDGRLLVFW